MYCLCKESGKQDSLLRKCSTNEITEHVTQCAKSLSDGDLLAYLSQGDLVAQDAHYHPKCLTRLYNKSRRSTCITDKNQIMCENLAFADLVYFFQSNLRESSKYVF